MALQYDQPTSSEDIQAVIDNRVLNSATSDAIAAILGLGEDVTVNVAAQEGNTYNVQPGQSPDLALFDAVPAEGEEDVTIYPLLDTTTSASAYIINSDANVTAEFTPVDSVIVSGNGNDNLTILGEANVTVDGGAGNDSITTGAGSDTIIAGEGADTVDGGEGYDAIQLTGGIDDYTVEVVDGQLVVTSIADPNVSVTASNVEFIQLDGASIAIAANQEEAQALRLYQAIFNRSSDIEGAEYWTDQIGEGVSALDIANLFLGSEEASEVYGDDLTDAVFIDSLYQNAFGRDADPDGLVYWTNALTNGDATRAEVVVQFVSAAEADDAINNVFILDGLV